MAAKKKAAVKKKAATKKTKPGTGLAVRSNNTAIANWEDRLGEMANNDAARGHNMGDSNFISTQGGIFTFQGAEISNPFYAIITDFSYENAYYDSAYDPDNPNSPACFAIGDDPDQLAPHDTSPACQVGAGEHCESCPMNEFASASTGRGKACKNGARLSLVNVTGLDNDIAMELANAASEPAFLRLAPTSLKHFEKYKDKFTKVTKRPLLAAVTELELVPNKTWYEVQFTLIEQIDDPQTLQNMLSVHDAYRDMLREPYDVSSYSAERPTPRRGKGGGNQATPTRGRSAAASKKGESPRRAAKY